MFVVVQLPFADARPFIGGAERLSMPPWPFAEPKREFVRSVGQVMARTQGGVTPWVGEEVYCDARRALRVDPSELDGRRSACKFRRYFSDGKVLSRIEVGIAAPAASKWDEPTAAGTGLRGSLGKTDSERLTDTLLRRLAAALSLAFRTPAPSGFIEGNLFDLHDVLARHLMRSTTRFRVDRPFLGESWWLQPIQPLVIVECRPDEGIAPPQHSRAVPVAVDHGISLHAFGIRVSKMPVKVWLLHPMDGADRDALRRLRIHLLRLHAERIALRQVLRMIATEKINTNRGAASFDRLQDYLLKGFHGLDRRYSHGFAQQAILDAAYRADGLVSESERNTILEQLKEARLNVLRNIERRLSAESLVSHFPSNFVHVEVDGDLVAGDRYVISGNAGAVGPYARVDSIKVQNVWHEIASEVDFDRLSIELEKLCEALRDGGSYDDKTVVGVAQAALAAQQRDGPRALTHLASIGRWILNVAGEVGADLTAAVIRELLKP